MDDSRKIQTIAWPSENPRQWLNDYLRIRAHLASQDSDFQCDPACTRPGCKNQDLQVPVSIVDLLGVALFRDEPVSEIYRRHYILGLFSNDRDDWIRTVAVRLKKPCPFLEHDLCGIYPVRPLPCMLFPEYLVSRGTFVAHAAQDQFRDYLCLHRPLQLTSDRAKVVAKLRNLWEREMLISSFYLFHHGPCHIDFGNLAKELLPAARSVILFFLFKKTIKDGGVGLHARHFPENVSSQRGHGKSEAGLEERQESSRFITNQDLEHFFRERMAGYQPFAGVAEKISHLDTREGQAQFRQIFQDDLLYKKLRQDGDDRALVFQFSKGKLKARRRGIIPTEYKFY